MMDLEVRVDPKLKGLVEGSISFETGLTRAQAADPTSYAYEHHGAEFSDIDPGALSSFVEDILLGRPMPTKFAASRLSVDTVFAIALFLHRDMATHPRLPGIVHSVDLAHRRGVQGLAHIEPDLVDLVLLMSETLSAHRRPKELAETMQLAVRWAYDFVHERDGVPLGPHIPQPQIQDVGTNGFVLAELPRGAMTLGWLRLYQQGYLRGVLLGPQNGDSRVVLASRKSVFVPFNLVKAADILNEVEVSLGKPPAWKADELWLYSPPHGTSIRVADLMEVFLRV